MRRLRWLRGLRARNARDLEQLVAAGTITAFDARMIALSCRGGFRYRPEAKA